MKTIDVLLYDDTANGIVEYIMNSYNVVGYRFKRDQLKNASKVLEKMNNAGIYLLFGNDNDVYVGQGSETINGVFGRLKDHNRDTKFSWWTETAVFTSSNDFLGATHVKYLEKIIAVDIKRIGRFKLKNYQKPGGQNATKKEVEESEEFLRNIKPITSLMGFNVFEEVTKESDIRKEDLLYLKYKGEVVALGAVTNDGFTIFKGSKIANEIKPGISKSLIACVEKERSSKDVKGGVFINNHPVSSPSIAGAVILGYNVNGRILWKNKDGKTLKSLSEEL